MFTAVQFMERVYGFFPIVTIPLNLLCILISSCFVSKRYAYLSPVSCLLFTLNIMQTLMLFVSMPVQIVDQGYVITAFLSVKSIFWPNFYSMFQVFESYTVFSTMLIYIVLSVRYKRSISTGKIHTVLSIVYLPMAVLIYLKNNKERKDWAKLDTVDQYHLEIAASKMFNLELNQFVFIVDNTEDNKNFYSGELVFLKVTCICSLLSFVLFQFLENTLSHEEIHQSKMMFSKDLRKATNFSIFLTLIGVVLPRASLNLMLLRQPKLSTHHTIAIYLGNILTSCMIPFLFLSHFYSKFFKRMLKQCFPTIKAPVTPQVTADDPSRYTAPTL